MSKELNIKSSTIEKGLELVKGFAEKLIGPSIEEIGLLAKDQVKLWRFKNQLNILLKAKTKVEDKGISIKIIPTKILLPLLEMASLEEDEELQDKWSNMIFNMVDTNQNLQNQVFPYILSQISIEEYNGLLQLHNVSTSIESDLDDYLENFEWTPDDIKEDETTKRLRAFEKRIETITQNGYILNLKGHERDNLERLGLVKERPPKIDLESPSGSRLDEITAKYDILGNGYLMTKLGYKFVEICELNEIDSSSKN